MQREVKVINTEIIQTEIYLKYTLYLLAVANNIYWVIREHESEFGELYMTSPAAEYEFQIPIAI